MLALKQFLQLCQELLDSIYGAGGTRDVDLVSAGNDADVELFLYQFEIEVVRSEQVGDQIVIFDYYFFIGGTQEGYLFGTGVSN